MLRRGSTIIHVIFCFNISSTYLKCNNRETDKERDFSICCFTSRLTTTTSRLSSGASGQNPIIHGRGLLVTAFLGATAESSIRDRATGTAISTAICCAGVESCGLSYRTATLTPSFALQKGYASPRSSFSE